MADFENQDNPICPWCEYEEEDWFELALQEDDWVEVSCNSCGKTYEVKMYTYSPTFDSKKL